MYAALVQLLKAWDGPLDELLEAAKILSPEHCGGSNWIGWGDGSTFTTINVERYFAGAYVDCTKRSGQIADIDFAAQQFILGHEVDGEIARFLVVSGDEATYERDGTLLYIRRNMR